MDKNIVLFEKYDFYNNDEYVLTFVGYPEGELFHNYKYFQIKDKEALNRIKKDWIFYTNSEIQPCGYSYKVVLKKNNKSEKEFNINLECNYLVINDKWITFDEVKLSKYEKYFENITKDTGSFQ